MPPVTGMVEVENPAPAVMNNTIAAFAVVGSDVPEPASIGLMGIAGGLLLFRQRIFRARRSSGYSSH